MKLEAEQSTKKILFCFFIDSVKRMILYNWQHSGIRYMLKAKTVSATHTQTINLNKNDQLHTSTI